MAPSIPRSWFRFIVANQRTLLALGLFLTFVGFGGAAWYYTHPEQATTEQRVDVVDVEVNVGTQATVTGDSALYQTGEVVRNSPLYLREVMPENLISVNTSFTNADRVNLTQTIAVKFTGKQDGKIFWEERRTLVKRQTVVTDGSKVIRTAIRIQSIAETLTDARKETGGRGSITATLRIKTAYETADYSNTITKALPISIARRTYTIGNGETAIQKSHYRTKTATITKYSANTGFFTGIGVLALLGLIGVWRIGRWQDDEFEAWKATLEEYDEWISRGTINESIDHTIEVETLPDLVDVAIEANARPVYDADQQTAVVITDAATYRWEPLSLSSDAQTGQGGSNEPDPGDDTIGPGAAAQRDQPTVDELGDLLDATPDEGDRVSADEDEHTASTEESRSGPGSNEGSSSARTDPNDRGRDSDTEFEFPND